MLNNDPSPRQRTSGQDEALRFLNGNPRIREVFSAIIKSYLETGSAASSRSVAKRLNEKVSSATVRNVMTDLEELCLIHAPHTSAGRLPTEKGLRFFVDCYLEVSTLTKEHKEMIDTFAQAGQGETLDELLSGYSAVISRLTNSACVVTAEKQDQPIKQIEFARLSADEVLVILVSRNGSIENRIIRVDPALPDASLREASHWVSKFAFGYRLADAEKSIREQMAQERSRINELVSGLIDSGLAAWSGQGKARQLIVRGQANLFGNPDVSADIHRIKSLLVDLEAKEGIADLLGNLDQSEGVRIFIGSESKLYSLSGSSVVAAPFHNPKLEVVGSIGVIGPTWLNYGSVIPMLDYTAQLVNTYLAQKG